MIDWNEAPEGAEYVSSDGSAFYKVVGGNTILWWDQWDSEWCEPGLNTSLSDLTPRPTAPKPYTLKQALQFLVDRLDVWPTDITDAPLCPGWGWECDEDGAITFGNDYTDIERYEYERELIRVKHGQLVSQPARYPECSRFVPSHSVADAQPALDMVNHPPHYQSDTGVECIDAIRAALGAQGFQAYCIGNTMKYLWREKSDKMEDLCKAAWYLNRAVEDAGK